MDYNSKRTGEQIEALLDIVQQGGSGGGSGGEVEKTTEAEITAMGFTKNIGTITEVKMNGASKGTSGVVDLGDVQTPIADLATIREGASKGATALQSVPSEYVTESELTAKGYATTVALNDKVDKVTGKGLSTEDFTTALKTKLEGLSNYDDTAINSAVTTLRSDFDKLVSGDTTTAIKTFNEIIAFLDGIADSESLDSIISSIEQQIAGKQATISDLATIRSGAASGATAVQPSSLSKVATSGSYNDLSDKPTIPDVSNKVDKVSGKGLSTNDYTTTEKNKLAGIAAGAEINVQSDWNVTDSSSDAYIKNKPSIPSAVTESTVSGWGFTKNTGTYSKPSGGIPKTDLASAVQTSLGKADTALQSYTEQYKGTVTGVKVNGSTKSPSSGTVDIGNVVTSVKVNGSTYSPSSGVVDLGTISGGGSSGGGSEYAGNYPVVEMFVGMADTITIEPNTYTILKPNIRTDSIDIILGNISNTDIVNEYAFELRCLEAVTLTMDAIVQWANSDIPTFQQDKTYVISIVNNLAVYAEF